MNCENIGEYLANKIFSTWSDGGRIVCLSTRVLGRSSDFTELSVRRRVCNLQPHHHEKTLTMNALLLSPQPPRRKASSLHSILAIVLLTFQLSAASPTCAILSPMKRPSSLAASTAIASTVALLPRGGGIGATKLSSTTKSTPTSTIQLSSIMKSFIQTIIDARSHLAAAAAARAVSIFGMYPVDTIKTRMQMKQGDAFRMSGLYKGVTGSLVGQVPYGCVYVSSASSAV
jgi:hypothetical protein